MVVILRDGLGNGGRRRDRGSAVYNRQYPANWNGTGGGFSNQLERFGASPDLWDCEPGPLITYTTARPGNNMKLHDSCSGPLVGGGADRDACSVYGILPK